MARSRPASTQSQEVRKPTPLPVRQLTILCIVLLTESVCSTMLIPFVGLYVAYLQNWTPEEAGYSSGFLIGLFMLGQVISSKMFGVASDKYGRKICIAVGVFWCAVSMFLFGLSPNIYMACIWRFTHGLFAGCSLVAKTMISDVTDRTNQAKGFALVSLTWGVGTLFGPTIGGFLYDPSRQPRLAWMHLSETGIFGRFPAFLPSTVAAAYNLFAVCVCVFLLPETNKQAQPLYTLFPPAIARRLRPLLRLVQPKLPGEGRAEEVLIVAGPAETATAPQSSSSPTPQTKSGTSDDTAKANQATAPSSVTKPSALQTRVTSATDTAPQSPVIRKPPSFGFKQAFQRRLTRNVCIMSMLISCSDMLYAEIFSLWGIASLAVGGLALPADEVAVLILANSVPAVIANIYFSKVVALFHSQMTYWRLTQCMYALLSVLVPFAPYLGRSAGYWYTLVLGIIRKVWETWTFALLMLTVAQTAPPGKIGIMYGVQQATACMVRCIVPFVGAPLFAWSLEGHKPFPFNHFFLFLLSAIPLLCSVVLSYKVHLPTEQEAEAAAAATAVSAEDEGGGGGAGSAAERRASQSGPQQLQGSLLVNRSFGNHSRRTFMFSAHNSFAGPPNLPLNNSFGTLANSFATNIVPGLLQQAMLPPHIDAVGHNEREEMSSSMVPSVDSRETISDEEERFDQLALQSQMASVQRAIQRDAEEQQDALRRGELMDATVEVVDSEDERELAGEEEELPDVERSE